MKDDKAFEQALREFKAKYRDIADQNFNDWPQHVQQAILQDADKIRNAS